MFENYECAQVALNFVYTNGSAFHSGMCAFPFDNGDLSNGAIIHLAAQRCCNGRPINPVCGHAFEMCDAAADFTPDVVLPTNADATGAPPTCAHMAAFLFNLTSVNCDSVMTAESGGTNYTYGWVMHSIGPLCCGGNSISQVRALAFRSLFLQAPCFFPLHLHPFPFAAALL
jgi:hypothetical protein